MGFYACELCVAGCRARMSTGNSRHDVSLELCRRRCAFSLVPQLVCDDAIHFVPRFAVWPKVREFLDSLPAGAVVADVGCGNGKYFGVRRDVAFVGSDRSVGLAEAAARRLDSGHPGGHLA